MTDIVVCVPQTKEGKTNFSHKTKDIGNAFWTMGRTPIRLRIHDWVWFVSDEAIVYGAEVKNLECGPLPEIDEAEGYNPPVKNGGCRLTFFDSYSASIWTDPNLEDHWFPRLPCKGFQGFRYKWWDWPWEAEDKASKETKLRMSK